MFQVPGASQYLSVGSGSTLGPTSLFSAFPATLEGRCLPAQVPSAAGCAPGPGQRLPVHGHRAALHLRGYSPGGQAAALPPPAWPWSPETRFQESQCCWLLAHLAARGPGVRLTALGDAESPQAQSSSGLKRGSVQRPGGGGQGAQGAEEGQHTCAQTAGHYLLMLLSERRPDSCGILDVT